MITKFLTGPGKGKVGAADNDLGSLGNRCARRAAIAYTVNERIPRCSYRERSQLEGEFFSAWLVKRRDVGRTGLDRYLVP
jgi:hypothetical protein